MGDQHSFLLDEIQNRRRGHAKLQHHLGVAFRSEGIKCLGHACDPHDRAMVIEDRRPAGTARIIPGHGHPSSLPIAGLRVIGHVAGNHARSESVKPSARMAHHPNRGAGWRSRRDWQVSKPVPFHLNDRHIVGLVDRQHRLHWAKPPVPCQHKIAAAGCTLQSVAADDKSAGVRKKETGAQFGELNAAVFEGVLSEESGTHLGLVTELGWGENVRAGWGQL